MDPYIAGGAVNFRASNAREQDLTKTNQVICCDNTEMANSRIPIAGTSFKTTLPLL